MTHGYEMRLLKLTIAHRTIAVSLNTRSTHTASLSCTRSLSVGTRWNGTPATKWAGTCNVTACRHAVTWQVNDTIRSYDLHFHPVPHGVTISCERYTMGFPFC
jgi:hypothetical protein